MGDVACDVDGVALSVAVEEEGVTGDEGVMTAAHYAHGVAAHGGEGDVSHAATALQGGR